MLNSIIKIQNFLMIYKMKKKHKGVNKELYLESSKKLILQYINIKDYENAFNILMKVLSNLDDDDFNKFSESFK